MQKFKPLTKEGLIKAVLAVMPEINPEFVRNVIKNASEIYFDVSAVPFWVSYFEAELYDERRK